MYFLKIGDEEFELGADSLSGIVSNLADTEENSPIFALLADHPSGEVRRQIAYKDKVDSETLNKLIDDSDIYVLRTVSCCSAFRENATSEQVLKLINIGDSEICRDIANYIESFRDADIADALLAHKDPSVRMALANNYGTPKNIVKKLLKDADIDVRKKAESR